MLRAGCLLALLGACSSDRVRPAELSTARDSAGVIYRRTSVPLPDAPPWPTEILYTTLALDVTPLGAFTDARFASDTSLVVTHDTDLLLLSPDGQFLRTIGRDGQGPGEFRLAVRLVTGADGTLLVGDGYTQRVTVFNPQSWAPRVVPYLGMAGTSYERDILTLLPNGRIVATYSQDRPNRDGPGIPHEGFERDSAPLLLFDSTGALSVALGTWLGLERTPTADIGGQQVRLAPAFARTVLAQGRGAYTAITPSDSLDLSLFRDTQLVFRLTGPPSTAHATRSQLEAWESAARTEHADVADQYLAIVRNAARVPHLPTLGGLGVDDQGNVWLGAYVPPGDTIGQWWIVSPRDGPLGSMMLPALPATTLPGHRELLDVYGDRLVLLRETAEGEPYLEVRRFRRPSAQQ